MFQTAPAVAASSFTPRLRSAQPVARPARMASVSKVVMAAAKKKSVGDLKGADLKGKKVSDSDVEPCGDLVTAGFDPLRSQRSP
eukprot:760025-Hanusia_phi.AAC.1